MTEPRPRLELERPIVVRRRPVWSKRSGCRPNMFVSPPRKAAATTAKPVLALSTMLGRSDGSTGAPAPGL
jgi:hypothetical protein